MRALEEDKPTFEESIELNTPMTPQEAIEKLATFYDSSAEVILAAFINLRGFENGTVTFKIGRQSGREVMVMEGQHPNGNFAWFHYFDRHTGNPIQIVG
jgi:hypothetical protein